MDGFLLCPFCCFFFCQRREFVFVPVFERSLFCVGVLLLCLRVFVFVSFFFLVYFRERLCSLGFFFFQEDFVFLFVVPFIFPLFSHFACFLFVCLLFCLFFLCFPI